MKIFIFFSFFLNSIIFAQTVLHLIAPTNLLDPIWFQEFEEKEKIQVIIDPIHQEGDQVLTARTLHKPVDVMILFLSTLQEYPEQNILHFLGENQKQIYYLPLINVPLGFSFFNLPQEPLWNQLCTPPLQASWRKSVYFQSKAAMLQILAHLQKIPSPLDPSSLPLYQKAWEPCTLQSYRGSFLPHALAQKKPQISVLWQHQYFTMKFYQPQLQFSVPQEFTLFDTLVVATLASTPQKDEALKLMKHIETLKQHFYQAWQIQYQRRPQDLFYEKTLYTPLQNL